MPRGKSPERFQPGGYDDRGVSVMCSSLRQRFLRSIDFDFAKLDLRAAGVRLKDPTPNGPDHWPIVRAWWWSVSP